jgi:hypothetical protein
MLNTGVRRNPNTGCSRRLGTTDITVGSRDPALLFKADELHAAIKAFVAEINKLRY